jgi:drug/metabolite transporter (DMT)-like permease
VAHGRAVGAGLGLAVVSAFTFATSGTFARSLIDAGWSAEAAVVARIGVAALILAAPAAWSLRGKWPVLRRNVRTLGLFGLLAVAGAQVGFFNAVRYLPIGVALLLEFFGIVLVVGWMWLVHRQRPSRLTLAGAVAAIAGLLFVLDLSGSSGFHPLGVVWGLVAAVGLAGYFVLSARSDPSLPPVVLATGGMGIGAVALGLAGLAGLLPLRATFGDVEFGGRVVSWLVPVAGLCLVAAVVSYVAGIAAARILGPRLSSFVGLTEVVFAFLIAWLVVNEVPTPRQLAGGALIVLGVALVRLGESRTGDAPSAAAPAEPVLAADER